MKRGLVAWLRDTARTKRGFLTHSMAMMGIPAVVMILADYGQYGDAGWKRYLICGTFGGAPAA